MAPLESAVIMLGLIKKSPEKVNFRHKYFSIWFLLIYFCLALFFYTDIYANPMEGAVFPPLVSSLKMDKPVDFCGEKVPIENQEIRERFEKELLLSLWDRPQVILWLKRSTRYFPHIDEILKKNGMPEDLKYVAIAESALRPHAGSPKGAIGFWQFVAGTGRRYGLVINNRIDERRNIFASTAAAIKYFKELHNIFHSWTLAAAAYNMGENGLKTEIMEQDIKDYYQLYLPIETQRYIFRILSAKLIFHDPEKYGFNLSEEDYYPSLTFDQIQVECKRETPIRIVAQAAKASFKEIKDLNPEIRGYYLQKGNHSILIPEGASEGFKARYQSSLEKFLAVQEKNIYIVKKGDNLSAIAERFGIPLSLLIIRNGLDIGSPIHPGDRLIIHTNK